MNATDLLLWSIVIHLFVDLFLQNQWQADNKTNLRHPAAWVHSGLHLFGFLVLFPPVPACLLALSHLLIDTRIPLEKWRTFTGQNPPAAIMPVFAFWQDQSAHIICLAVMASFVGR